MKFDAVTHRRSMVDLACVGGALAAAALLTSFWLKGGPGPTAPPTPAPVLEQPQVLAPGRIVAPPPPPRPLTPAPRPQLPSSGEPRLEVRR